MTRYSVYIGLALLDTHTHTETTRDVLLRKEWKWKKFGALVGIVSKSPYRLRASSSRQSKERERDREQEQLSSPKRLKTQASIAYFRGEPSTSTQHEHAARTRVARHNWWVLYLMIMATIMMIGMALMALKMKIACSRFLCALCRPDTGPLLLCVRVSLALCACSCVCVCLSWMGTSLCVCVCVSALCYFLLLHLLTQIEGGGKERRGAGLGAMLTTTHYQHLIILRSFVCM